MTFPRPDDDEERIAVLRELGILDTGPDENLQRIVHLCRLIFGVEISTVSLIDEARQWFKARDGLDACETSRDVAFCNYTILGDDIFEVPDALEHPDFKENPLVTGDPRIRFYAGAPIRFDGKRFGALCLIDSSPREPLDQRERSILIDLAAIVEREIRIQRMFRESMALLTEVIKKK